MDGKRESERESEKDEKNDVKYRQDRQSTECHTTPNHNLFLRKRQTDQWHKSCFEQK